MLVAELLFLLSAKTGFQRVSLGGLAGFVSAAVRQFCLRCCDCFCRFFLVGGVFPGVFSAGRCCSCAMVGSVSAFLIYGDCFV